MYYKVTAKYKTDEDNTTFEFIADTEDIQHIYDAAEDEGEEMLLGKISLLSEKLDCRVFDTTEAEFIF